MLPPESAAPYVTLSKSFDGRVRRLGTGSRDGEPSDYGRTASPDSLTWAADQAQPGPVEPVAASVTAGSARQEASSSADSGSPSPPTAQTQAYSDGLGDRFWEDLEAEIDAGDDREVGPIPEDGEIVHMVRHADVAWHASRANRTSIGIEHVANTRGLTPTSQQHAASAGLVRWLCDHYQIPVDREHVLGHSEADHGTTHRRSPNAVWDWDH